MCIVSSVDFPQWQSDSVGVGEASGCAFLTSSQGMLTLQACGPHFECEGSEPGGGHSGKEQTTFLRFTRDSELSEEEQVVSCSVSQFLCVAEPGCGPASEHVVAEAISIQHWWVLCKLVSIPRPFVSQEGAQLS